MATITEYKTALLRSTGYPEKRVFLVALIGIFILELYYIFPAVRLMMNTDKLYSHVNACCGYTNYKKSSSDEAPKEKSESSSRNVGSWSDVIRREPCSSSNLSRIDVELTCCRYSDRRDLRTFRFKDELIGYQCKNLNQNLSTEREQSLLIDRVLSLGIKSVIDNLGLMLLWLISALFIVVSARLIIVGAMEILTHALEQKFIGVVVFGLCFIFLLPIMLLASLAFGIWVFYHNDILIDHLTVLWKKPIFSW